MSALNRYPDESPGSPVDAGAHAATVLKEACRRSMPPGGSLRLEVVRGLALDLERQLGALSGMADGGDGAADSLVEAALACADLATLAVCNLPALSAGEAREVRAAVRLAADAARELSRRVEAESGKLGDEHAEYVARDARGAVWRAELAAQQADGRSAGGKLV